jgi:hypothetical protein
MYLVPIVLLCGKMFKVASKLETFDSFVQPDVLPTVRRLIFIAIPVSKIGTGRINLRTIAIRLSIP